MTDLGESETEKLVWLQKELQAGLDDIAAGRVIDGKDVFAVLKFRFDRRRRPGVGRDPRVRGRNG